MPTRREPRHLQAVPAARFQVRLTVPRQGGVLRWLRASGDFERRLAEQQDPAVAEAGIESESRRGRDYVTVRILMTVGAVDVATLVQSDFVVADTLDGSVSGFRVVPLTTGLALDRPQTLHVGVTASEPGTVSSQPTTSTAIQVDSVIRSRIRPLASTAAPGNVCPSQGGSSA